MKIRSAMKWTAGIVVALAALAAGMFTRDTWQPWLFKAQPSRGEEAKPADHDHKEIERLTLSPQAKTNLNLIVKPAKLATYWRSIEVPGMVVDQPGRSDRGITAPVAGVVKEIHALPGDTVKPNDTLVTLRIVSETFLTSQTELFKTNREVQFAKERKDRLADTAKSGGVPPIQLAELDSQIKRLSGALQAYRQDLLARGLSTEQINGIGDGKFVTEITVSAPKALMDSKLLVSTRPTASSADLLAKSELAYEVQELKIQLGEQVQAGQLLGLLANHQNLLIEGRGFKHEAGLIERAAQENWPLNLEFSEEQGSAWPRQEQVFQIRYLANTVDAVSRTFPFYIPLINNSRPYEKEGKTFLVWRFRPGQRVRLQVPVERFQEVFVLPVEGLVREGADAFVFRQNGDFYERKPVHVLFEDRRNVVIANDGSLGGGWFLATNAAASLNRILKAQAEGDGESEHEHSGHSHDH